jgi:DNA helicase-2/ATP-dependent DNA helicase PcrA
VLASVSDDGGQAEYVVDHVLANREAGMTLKAQAVLFRTSNHSATLEIELARRNIPFVKFGGLKFLETAHVKDVLAVLRWAHNLRDRVAGFRVCQLLPAVGPGIAGKLLNEIAANGIALAGLQGFRPPAAAAAHWQDFVDTMSTLHLAVAGWPAELDLARRWYLPHMEQRYEDAAQRQEDLLLLAQIAVSYPTREQFLTDLTLDPPDATSDQADSPLLDEDYLILSTIHSAKGQEWSSVFVLNTVDGCIPSDLGVGSTPEIEEERRLLYVAMTRAKDQLHLIVPQRFFTHGQRSLGNRHVYAQRTRFIPNRLTKYFRSLSWPRYKAPNRSDRAVRTPVDVRARARGMWS